MSGATVEELYRTEGQAELVGGRIVRLPLHGMTESAAVGAILFALRPYRNGASLPGVVLGSTVAYLVELPERRSFCPDVAYYVGPNSGMKFCDGAPRFAVEVRGEADYGPAAEEEMAAKRADYFAAGTELVWDVDLVGADTVRKYTAGAPTAPVVYRRGQTADAAPAVPGWPMPVDDLFETV